jgi:hypothetical protein
MSLWTFHGDEKFSIVWDTKRDRCDPTIQESTITIQAKVTYKRNVEYKIPITINYNKQSSTVDIIGPDFELRNIPVNDLNNPFHSDNGEPYEQPDETPSQDPPTSPSESHNVALVDFSNSINMMRLEETNGTDILGSDLMCNNKYKIWIKVENHGDFAENVTFTGNINGLTFNHLPKDDLTPGSSSQKSRTVQFSLPAGTHTISVEAHIPNDSNPSDNIAQRTINIICP